MSQLEVAPLAPRAAASSALLARALEVCPQAVSIVDVRDPAQPLVWVNHAFELLTGYQRSEILGRNCRLMQAGDADFDQRRRIREAVRSGEHAMVTLANVRKDGSRFINSLSLEPLHDDGGELTHYVGLQAEVSEHDRRRTDEYAEAGLRRGVPPLEVLYDRIEQSLSRAQTIGTRFALLMVELAPGHNDRSATCHDVAAVIGEAAADASASLLLLGAGRMALLVDPAPPPAGVADLAHRMLEAVDQHLLRAGDGRFCTIGIATGPADGASAQTVELAARRALDRARLRAPEGALAFFAHTEDAQWLEQRQLEADLAAAVAGQQFTLNYQPLVQLDNGQIMGFEALIRWSHPVRGPIPPGQFIPLAEASGMIDEIGDWVLGEALAQLAAFDRVCARPLRMAVNVSASQLARPGFADTVRASLNRHAIAGGRLELEITERTFTGDDPAITQALHALRKLGVRRAVDDFGTGYSNLQGLTLLPVDTLKIDMSLTQAVTHNAAAASVSRMVCELARALGLKLVVEGIETEGQLAHFRRLGPLLGQGWLFSRALDATAALALLASARSLVPAGNREDKPQLLLLDDEPNILAALRRTLRRDGWCVHATGSPQEALDILAAHPVGVVISDQRMPQMNGTEFLRQVRQLYPETVRILLSGYSEIAAVTAAVNEGAVWKYLSKPWDEEALREQVRLAFVEHGALQQARQQHERALQAHTRLQAEVSRRDIQLAMGAQALASARDVLLELPVAVLGVDPAAMIVLSNAVADGLFGDGAPLIGRALAEVLPAEAAAAGPRWLRRRLALKGCDYVLHTQPLGDRDGAAGSLLCLVPGTEA
ncbi:MAG: EAL domain-containing protein [Burkholderiaceae bacterium]|nr:EAL domain-containing protein [Burkholderiaceae bacterium]